MNINYFFSNLIRYRFNKFIHEEESFGEYVLILSEDYFIAIHVFLIHDCTAGQKLSTDVNIR